MGGGERVHTHTYMPVGAFKIIFHVYCIRNPTLLQQTWQLVVIVVAAVVLVAVTVAVAALPLR